MKNNAVRAYHQVLWGPLQPTECFGWGGCYASLHFGDQVDVLGSHNEFDSKFG